MTSYTQNWVYGWNDKPDRADDVGGMPSVPYGSLHQVEIVTAPVALAAELAVHIARKLRRVPPRTLRGAILRPGRDTPRWNKLAEAAAKLLRRRGDKVRLARFLGISRQRLHLLLKARTACPDAERALLLREWVELRQRGLDLV